MKTLANQGSSPHQIKKNILVYKHDCEEVDVRPIGLGDKDEILQGSKSGDDQTPPQNGIDRAKL